MSRHKWVRALRLILLMMAALMAVVTLGGWLALRASLPMQDGELRHGAVSAPVTIERDSYGAPRIIGESRRDVSFALGYLHAQERFFQMDLLRRSAAGELAELFGPATKDMDRKRRLFRPRQLARRSIDQMSQEHLDLLYAYRDGVNAGLENLKVRPFEYFLLLKKPDPWTVEDSILAGMVMYFDLQDELAQQDITRFALAKVVPESVCNFLTQFGGPWQAALDGSELPTVAIPPAADWQYLRGIDAGMTDLTHPIDVNAYGSNAWAVGGAHTSHGGATLANDMHLNLRLPNIWYRAQLIVAHEGLNVVGATLPGLPLIVTGSNGFVAWGFTNSYADTANLVRIDAAREGRYLTASGPRAFEYFDFPIRVRFGADEWVSMQETVWGPVVEAAGENVSIFWAGSHFPANLSLIELERAQTLEAALTAANNAHAPAQNIVIASSDGRVAWTIAGDLPEFPANDGFAPAVSSQLAAIQPAKLPPERLPRVVATENGIVWSANNRTMGGNAFARLGDGGLSEDARAWQIKKGLMERADWREKDHLALQLDARAYYLDRWSELLLETLQASDAPGLQAIIPMITNWGGEAVPDSADYRFVNDFSEAVIARLASRLLKPVIDQYPEFEPWRLRLDQPMYQIASEKPDYLADPELGTIDAELEMVALEVLKHLTQDGKRPIEEAVWGERNFLDIDHPITLLAPFLSPWLNQEGTPLPGDMHTPRASRAGFGASVRMVVSPGREESGIFHMPGGQSGHPLSPHYEDTTDAWIKGEPLPLLPGPAEHTLRILPLNNGD